MERLEVGNKPTAFGQLARGLAGERQTEHRITRNEAVRHEPDDPPRHGLGLAAAGAGDDERGREGRGDHARLFIGGRELAECGRECGGRDDAREALTALIVWIRQRP